MQVLADKKRFRFAFFVSAILTLLIWVVWLLAELSGDSITGMGIRPREAEGLTGIVLSPFIHGNFMHLFSNTLPLFILTALATYAYRGLFIKVILSIIILGGTSVWFIGVSGTSHIGASGLVYGLASFLFFSGILRWETRQLIISAVVVFLYGSLVWGMLPIEPGVSWEGHLSGGLGGMIVAFYFRKALSWPPVPFVRLDDPGPAWEPEVFEQEIRHYVKIHLPPDPHYTGNRSVKKADFEVPESRQRNL